MSETEPPKKRAKGSMKSYGRQNAGKTIKSVSLDKDVALFGEAEAAKLGISFSQWVNNLLADKNPAEPPAPAKKKGKQ